MSNRNAVILLFVLAVVTAGAVWLYTPRTLPMVSPVKPISIQAIESLKILEVGPVDTFIAPSKYPNIQSDFDLRDHIIKVSYQELDDAKGLYHLRIELDELGHQKFDSIERRAVRNKGHLITFVNDYCVSKLVATYDDQIHVHWFVDVFTARNIDELRSVLPPKWAHEITP